MSKLDNIKIFNSPITKDVYLCSVNKNNIITEKRKLNEEEMAEFVFGIVKTLENKYGSDIKFEDDLLIINVEVLHKQLTHQQEDKGEEKHHNIDCKKKNDVIE